MVFQPANPRAMPATHQLLDKLYALWGQWTLSGQANRLSGLDRETSRVQEITGELPAVWAADFGWSADKDSDDYVGDRDGLLSEAERQHRAGSLVQLDWFPVNPVRSEPCGFGEALVEPISDRDFSAMLTPGTTVHSRWLTQLAIIGVFLRYLKEMGIVVLFRPCPDMNGSRWWWCDRPGPAGYVGLWRSIFDNFVQLQHLDNLLWVWSVEAWPLSGSKAQAPGFYYPGHDMVDILAGDFLGDGLLSKADQDFMHQGCWNGLQAIAAGRPLAIGQTKVIPDNAMLSRHRWLWCTANAFSQQFRPQNEEVRTWYAGDYLLHQADWQLSRQNS